MACRIASALKRSAEITRQGRKPRCSSATVWSSVANQIWPWCNRHPSYSGHSSAAEVSGSQAVTSASSVM
jgi:hypothetical protein